MSILKLENFMRKYQLKEDTKSENEFKKIITILFILEIQK